MLRALTVLLILGALCDLPSAFASDVDPLIQRRIHSPAEINLNLAEHVARLYRASDADSVKIVLRAWQDRVGRNEMIQRFDTLWRMERNEFFTSEIDSDYFDRLLAYRWWSSFWNDGEFATLNDLGRADYGYPGNFEAVTVEMAAKLAGGSSPGTDDYLIATAYQNQFPYFFDLLKGPQGEGTALREEYDRRVNEIHDAKEEYFTLYLGYWKPGGGAEVLGEHPSFGFAWNGISKRYMAGFLLGMQPDDLPDPVRVDLGDDVVETKNAVGLDLHLDLGMHLRKGIRATTTAFVGVGVSDYRIFHGDEDPPDAEDFITPTVSFGLLHRYRFREHHSHCLNLMLRYTIANYENDHGTEFHGNSISIMLGWGYSARDKYRALAALQ